MFPRPQYLAENGLLPLPFRGLGHILLCLAIRHHRLANDTADVGRPVLRPRIAGIAGLRTVRGLVYYDLLRHDDNTRAEKAGHSEVHFEILGYGGYRIHTYLHLIYLLIYHLNFITEL